MNSRELFAARRAADQAAAAWAAATIRKDDAAAEYHLKVMRAQLAHVKRIIEQETGYEGAADQDRRHDSLVDRAE